CCRDRARSRRTSSASSRRRVTVSLCQCLAQCVVDVDQHGVAVTLLGLGTVDQVIKAIGHQESFAVFLAAGFLAAGFFVVAFRAGAFFTGAFFTGAGPLSAAGRAGGCGGLGVCLVAPAAVRAAVRAVP